MAREFKLPDLGEGIHEGEVISILVSVGDKVEEGDPILEVETDKASVEIPSPFTATVEEIKVEAGDVVSVGDVLMTFSDVESEADVKALAEEESAKKEEKKEKIGKGKEKQKAQEEEKEKAEAKEKAERETEAETRREKPARKEGRPVPASPSTRRLARELDVDLRAVEPTGPGGRVTAEDVRAFAEEEKKKPPAEKEERPAAEEAEAAAPAPAPELPDFSRWGEVEKQALRSIRKATARQMAISWSQIPHVTTQDDVDLTRLEDLRQKHKDAVEAEGGKLTVTVFAVKAVAAALKKFPQFNVSLDPENQEIIRKKYCHVGVAADTGQGLVVPVLRDADRKSIFEIAVELNDLVQRTRARQLELEEMKGGCMTVTNIGAAGGRGHFAPIINYPESAILGLSAARMQPVVRQKGNGDFRMVPRLIMPVVLTIDHRVLDGVDSTQFLAFFRNALEDPGAMLLHI